MKGAKKSDIVVVERQDKQGSTMPAVPEGRSLSLIEIAVRRGDSMEMVSKLMDLQDRHDAKQAKMAFVQAMSMFKSEHLKISKNKTVGYQHRSGGGSTSYAYSTLDNILEVAVPVMSQYGLSATWDTKQEGDKIIVTCILSHSMGHSESVTLHADPDDSGNKNKIQQVASTVSYLERYTFLAITGLSVGDNPSDDGGQGGSETLSEEKIKEFIGRLGKCTTIEEIDKALADASKACMKLNDLKSYKIIGTQYNKIKDLIENPPE